MTNERDPAPADIATTTTTTSITALARTDSAEENVKRNNILTKWLVTSISCKFQSRIYSIH